MGIRRIPRELEKEIREVKKGYEKLGRDIKDVEAMKNIAKISEKNRKILFRFK